MKDLTGKRFGKLLVTGRCPQKENSPRWLCRCDCGEIVEHFTATLEKLRDQRCRCCRAEERARKNYVAKGYRGMSIDEYARITRELARIGTVR